jgi:PAS domain S-box-containing protein
MTTETNNPATILLVDDTPGSIGVALVALEEAGYRVAIATNAGKALQRAELVRPDLILLDVLMPGQDGYETCRQLKAQESTRDIPVIFLSAVSESLDKVRGFGLGAVDYLIKPVASEELLARVRTHVTLSRLERELRSANRTLEERVAARTAELGAANEALRLNTDRMDILLQLNQMAGSSLEEITTFAFDAAVRLTRSKLGYLAFMNEDETALTIQLWSREAMAGCRVAGPPKVFPVAATGLWGESVRQRRAVITNDYAAPNPLKKGTPEGHVPITRHMSLPVIVGGRVVLVAGVGNKEEEYNETDVQQLTLLMEGMWRLIERKRAQETHSADLWFFESMDKINRAMQGAEGLDQMMSGVLDTMLSIFGCDRAFLAVPCDPTMPEFSISMERTTPQYPGAFARRTTVPMSPAVRNLFHELLNNPAPNEIHVGNGLDPEDVVWKTYEIKSQLAIALHPKVGKPWECGLHQCSHSRIWSPQEKKLFVEISRRLGDALTSLLTHRNLQDSEQRFRMVFENSPVSIWVEDFSAVKILFDDLKAKGIADLEAWFDQHPEAVQECAQLARIVDVNQAALTLHGATDKAELLAGLVNTFTPESFRTFRQALVCLWNGRTAAPGDAIVRTLAGEPRHVTVHFSVCPGSELTLARVLVSLTDITERKQAEEALVRLNAELEQRVKDRTAALEQEMDSRFRQQQFLEAVLESTDAGIVACDADGVLTFFNRKTRELHGLPQTPIPAEQWAGHYDLFLPDGRTPMRKEDVPLFRALQGERVVNDEMMIIPRVGEPKILLASGQPILDKEGRKIGAVVAMHDITGRKRIEETLRASEVKYRNVVENIGVGVTMISPRMEVLAQNTCMQKYFPHVDVLRRPICYECYINPPRSGLCEGCPTHQTLQDGQVHESIIETPSGDRTLYFRVLSSPIKDRDGKVVAATEIVENVTESQAVEKELRQHREHLEELINERTAELEKTNDLLRSELAERQRAEEALRRLNQELDQRVKERTAELEQRNRDLERMNKVFIGRELRMVELKEQLRRLGSETTGGIKPTGRRTDDAPPSPQKT